MPRGKRRTPYPKEKPTYAARVYRLASLLVEHPEWGYFRLNRALVKEFGMGIKKQEMLRHIENVRRTQREAKALTPITVETAIKPHIRKGKKLPSHTKRQMVSGEWRYQWFADVRLVIKIFTPVAKTWTKFLRLYMMTGTLLEFNRYVASGKAVIRIKEMIRRHNVGGVVVGWSLMSYFPAKLGMEPV